MKILLLTSNLLAGIGQVVARYKTLLESMSSNHTVTVTLKLFHDPLEKHNAYAYDVGFAFVLPLKPMLERADAHLAQCARVIRMTVCETVPCHPSYTVFATYKVMYTPSEFARDILRTRVPEVDWRVFPHWAPTPPPGPEAQKLSAAPYTFYTIGNVIDFRKNIKTLIRAFDACGFPDGSARVLLKATCKQPVQVHHPAVVVVNDMLTPAQLDAIHDMCDCYVNCSFSEGVGMGTVEAALHNKPVIMTDFGGGKEYVRTEYTVACPTTTAVGRDEFLFEKNARWGDPRFDDLVRHMKHVFDNRVSRCDHPFTRHKMLDVQHQAAALFEMNNEA